MAATQLRSPFVLYTTYYFAFPAFALFPAARRLAYFSSFAAIGPSADSRCRGADMPLMSMPILFRDANTGGASRQFEHSACARDH